MAKIVVVEPDSQLREWLRLHLQTEGHVVQAVADAARVLDLVRGEQPELAILATALPAGGCFALVAALRSSPRSALMPLLFIVPAGDTAALAQAMAIEPEGVLTQPLNRARLLEAVTSRLYRSITTANVGLATLEEQRVETQDRVSGVLVESKEGTVLLMVLRNLVTLARSLRGRTLETMLQRFYSDCRDVVSKQGGWVVRMDATGLSALFEDGPNVDRHYSTRAVESALGVVLAARRVRQWATANLTDVFVPPLSLGCGVHTGSVIVSRISVTTQFSPSIAGPTVEMAQRLDGRAKGLGWSIAVSGPAAAQAGVRFLYGRQATVTDTDHGTTIPIVEVHGFNPGMAKPGELTMMTEAREAVLANTVIARLAGDVDPSVTDRTVMFTAQRPVGEDRLPELRDRRIARRLAKGVHSTTYVALNVPRDREEIIKIVPMAEAPPEFVERYLEHYAKLVNLDQRNVVSVYDTGTTDAVGFVAFECLWGGPLSEAIRRKVPIGLALNYVAQMSLALDAVHALGLHHGALGPQHFLFRDTGVVVLADFNVTAKVLDSLTPEGARAADDPAAVDDAASARRRDFKALGLMLCSLLGVVPEGAELDLDTPSAHIDQLLRIPIEITQLRPSLEGLLGIGANAPFDRAEEVLVELLALREVFPFDVRSEGEEGSSLLK
ncbi:MAG: response regulator [Betaproteobacteria bacterium]